ncbi:hypothetical protein P4V86_15555 [Brevibacillus laterosporus]|uniref:hypothetical protein n=1 Tax=Brevibacillus laterosporus TaxID=1465 RepID=UPI000364469D|nr:hypothetical protein [Brevibacillus laterosporus]ATO50979.1 hypothetical protein BrL25_18900 [Brevibacillus laterosporus DSM 25]MED2004762.1 hypothetical protein [Brevibacillus laterosporus]
MMTREEIGAIRERAEKATEGSWKWQEYYDCSLSNSEGNVIVTVVGDDMSYIKVLRNEDAEFIAHAREDIPKLLAEIERLQTNWQRLEEYVCEWQDKSFEDHDVSESSGAQYFFAGRLSAFNNVQEMIRALEREGEEC